MDVEPGRHLHALYLLEEKGENSPSEYPLHIALEATGDLITVLLRQENIETEEKATAIKKKWEAFFASL